MENRFGLKDFFLFLLLTILIVIVLLAIKQYDRQWKEIQAIGGRLDSQARDLREIHDALDRGVAVAVNPNGGGPTSTTAEAPNEDPFARLRAAQKVPGYVKGDWLVDAFGNSVGRLTPLISSDVYASNVQDQVLESLASRDPDTLEWRPLLCTGWQVIDNSKAYEEYEKQQIAAGKKAEDVAKDEKAPNAIQIKFKMRSGVRFSDGTPLTADDVVFTYQFTMDPKINSPRDKAYLSRIVSVEKTGVDEVTFTYREPYFEAFQLAAGIGILPRHFYSQFTPEDFNQSVGYLMGSGPYRLSDPKTWRPGDQIELVRNERYWGVQPAFDRLIWKIITNDAAHLAAFRNGDIDVFGAAPEQYKEMLADPTLVARTAHFEYQNPIGGYRFVAWNQQHQGKPTVFADKRVRQAMTLLLNREQMIQEIMLGYAVLATGPFNPLSKQYDPEVKPWPYDVARAKQLLKDAGFTDRNGDGILDGPDGVPFEFKLTYPSGTQAAEKLALFMKDAYARAGVVMKQDPLDWAVLVERLNKKNFEAITLGWSAGIETDIYQMFHSAQMIEEGDDFMSYKNEELDAVIQEARRTLDEDRRMALWRKAHAILHEDQPYTFLTFGKSLVFVDNRIENVKRVKLGLTPRVEWFVPAARQRWTR